MEHRRGVDKRKEQKWRRQGGLIDELDMNEKGEEKRYSWYEIYIKQLTTEGGQLIGKKQKRGRQGEVIGELELNENGEEKRYGQFEQQQYERNIKN